MLLLYFYFFFNDPATTEIYTLSLHDALPIWRLADAVHVLPQQGGDRPVAAVRDRSEEHTSELQSRRDLVCRLLLEKKKKKGRRQRHHDGTHEIQPHSTDRVEVLGGDRR